MKLMIVTDEIFIIVIIWMIFNSFILKVKNIAKFSDSFLTSCSIDIICKTMSTETFYGTSYLNSFFHVLLIKLSDTKSFAWYNIYISVLT